MRMKSSVVIISSFLLTAAIGWATYNKKKQFYPTVVYLTNNQTCIAILLFQCAVLLFLFAKLLIRLFFGRLQQAEIDNLVSQSWYAFFDMCLVFAFFQDELGLEFIFLFSMLLLVRAFHWLIEERVDYMERTPVINFLFHLRVLALIFLLGVIDAFYIRKTYLNPSSHGLSVHIALGIEYFILLLSLFSVTLRYIMHSIDSMREHPWDKKTMYLLYVDIIVGVIRLAIYAEFAVLMWTLHPFPLYIVRPIYLSVRTLKKSIQDVLMSRRAIRYMNTVFSDATSADLAAFSDSVCIICREEMQLPSADATPNQTTVLKKLPCSHIFHASCLRSWFQRQQTCPTCRMDIIRQARQQELQGQRQPNRGQNGQSSAGSTGTTASTTNNTVSASNADSSGRPLWMPPPGAFPYYPSWPPYSPTTSASQPPNMPLPPPPFPSFPATLFTPPFMGMPVIYPGSLFPNATLPMPEPPSGGPSSLTEAQLRASAEARFIALRQINVLLNAAVLQMNAYLNAATVPLTEIDNSPLTTSVQSDVAPTVAASTATAAVEPTAELLETATSDTVVAEAEPSVSQPDDASEFPGLPDVRKKRVEHFVVNSDEERSKKDH